MPSSAALLSAICSLALASDGTAIEFSGPFANRAAAIVKHSTIHAATPWEAVPADADLYGWMIDHPAASAAVWSAIGLQVGTVETLPDGWRSRDPDGFVFEFRRIHYSVGIRGYYCRATAPTGAIPRTATIEIVLLHRVGASEGVAVDRLEAWVSAEGSALRFMMKMAKGAVSNAVVRALKETRQYFALAARIAERRPEWARTAVIGRPGAMTAAETAELAAHLDRVSPIARVEAVRPNG